MAKLPPANLLIPPRGASLRGAYYTTLTPHGLTIRSWPKPQPRPRTERERVARDNIATATRVSIYIDALFQEFSRELSKRTTLLPRDMLIIGLFGRVGVVTHKSGTKVFSMAAVQDVSDLLDAIAQLKGDIIFRGSNWWQRLPAGQPGQVLAVSGDGTPEWIDGGGGGGSGWTNLAVLSTSLGAFWSASDIHPPIAPISVVPGDYVEVRAFAERPIGTNFALDLSPDMAHCAQASIQLDNNYVLMRFAAANNTYTLLRGGNYYQDFAGLHVIEMTVQVGLPGQPHLVGSRVNSGYPFGSDKAASISEADFPVRASGLIYPCVGISGTTPPTIRALQYRVTHT